MRTCLTGRPAVALALFSRDAPRFLNGLLFSGEEKAFKDSGEMHSHRGACGLGIAVPQRIENCAMLVDDGLDVGMASLRMKECTFRRFGAQIPKLPDRIEDRAISSSRGNREMEIAVGVIGPFRIKVFLRDCRDEGLDFLKILIADLGRGKCGSFAFDEKPCLGDLKGGEVESWHIGLAWKPADIGAGTDPDLDEALHFERDHRLADGWAADVIVLCKIAFSRKSASKRESPGGKVLDQFPGHFLIETVASACSFLSQFRLHLSYQSGLHASGNWPSQSSDW